MKQKNALAIHDISCVGRCSLTVALPILSATGIETSVLPTSILSTHTGGFVGYTFHDLTGEVTPITNHWESLGLKFDAFYTGYLGSFEQINMIKDIFHRLSKEDTIRFVDPVMADNGKLYAAFDETFPSGMRSLCECADVVVPNITEACLMLKKEYKEKYDKKYIEDLLVSMTNLGPRMAIISGVSFDENHIGAMAYDKVTKEYCEYYGNRVPGYFHGTGDVFGSALLAAILHDTPLKKALQIAVDFTYGSICRTLESGRDRKFGVDFENGLYDLAASLRLK